MRPQCVDRIGAARRREAAALSEQRAHQPAVALDGDHQQTRKQRRPARHGRPPLDVAGAQRARAASRSAARLALEAVAAAGSTRTTTVAVSGRTASRGRIRCRNWRRMWLRTTAPPTARGTTNPTRAPPATALAVTGVTGVTVTGIRWTTRAGRQARRPCRTVELKSERCRSRDAAGSTGIRVRSSGRKALTTLPAASSEDGAAGTRTHAKPKTVGLRAATIVRLERALAHSGTPETRKVQWQCSGGCSGR
jgi:hypothetical protein